MQNDSGDEHSWGWWPGQVEVSPAQPLDIVEPVEP